MQSNRNKNTTARSHLWSDHTSRDVLSRVLVPHPSHQTRIAFSPDTHLTSTHDVVCALLTAMLVVPITTFDARRPCLFCGFGTCVEQPVIVCQEWASVASWRLYFSVVVWQSWWDDRDCTAQYNCCLPATTDCRRFNLSFVFLVLFVWCPCNVFDMIVSF